MMTFGRIETEEDRRRRLRAQGAHRARARRAAETGADPFASVGPGYCAACGRPHREPVCRCCRGCDARG